MQIDKNRKCSTNIIGYYIYRYYRNNYHYFIWPWENKYNRVRGKANFQGVPNKSQACYPLSQTVSQSKTLSYNFSVRNHLILFFTKYKVPIDGVSNNMILTIQEAFPLFVQMFMTEHQIMLYSFTRNPEAQLLASVLQRLNPGFHWLALISLCKLQCLSLAEM